MVQQGDLLIVQRGTIGKLTIVESDIGEATINPSMVIVRFRSSTPSYVRYFLQSLQGQKQIVVDTSSTSVPMISQKQIENFQIPFPPTIEEQSAIAAALSDVDALLGALDRLIAKKRDLKQAAMQQLLTGKTRLPGFTGEWRVKRLGDVAEIVMGQSPASANYNASGHGLPLIQGNADIRDRMTIRRIYTTQVTKHGQAGDVLMSVRAPVGEVARTTFECCLGRGVCAIRYPNTFLYHALISKEADWAKLSKGSTFDSVNSAEVRAFELDWPTDPAEQIAIATLLTDMDAELAALERRQAKTRALKQGMMQELLTGSTRLVSAERADA